MFDTQQLAEEKYNNNIMSTSKSWCCNFREHLCSHFRSDWNRLSVALI